MALNVVFMGTPAFSVPVIDALVNAGHRIVAVYSQPPRPAGRGMELTKSPVHARAESLGLEVRTPRTLKDAAEQQVFADLKADVAVVVAYGLMLPKAVLDAPKHGCLNLHGSLLPRWRGAAPIERAVMAGDQETGVEVMHMAEGLDTGPVALTARVAIGPDETSGHLRERLSVLGADLMAEALTQLEAGTLPSISQSDEGVLYAAKIQKAETRIDWSKPAADVHNHIRGLSPAPGAWCEMPIGSKLERVKILATTLAEGSGQPGEVLDGALTIACGSGAIRLVTLQKAGGKPVDTTAFTRGTALAVGTILP
jgi:methionyl-tRNA formyltransferase